MWALLPRGTQVLVIVMAGVLLAWGIEAAVTASTGTDPGRLKFVSLAASTLAVVGVWLLNLVWRPLWRRLPMLGRHVFPDLNGEWKGHLLSTWIDPKTNATPPPIPTTVIIRQGLFDVHVTLGTGESSSQSSRVWLERFPKAGLYRVWYSYDNEPDARVRDRSQPHEGVAFLELKAEKPDTLTGRYYTARKTTGDIVVARPVASAV